MVVTRLAWFTGRLAGVVVFAAGGLPGALAAVLRGVRSTKGLSLLAIVDFFVLTRSRVVPNIAHQR